MSEKSFHAVEKSSAIGSPLRIGIFVQLALAERNFAAEKRVDAMVSMDMLGPSWDAVVRNGKRCC